MRGAEEERDGWVKEREREGAGAVEMHGNDGRRRRCVCKDEKCNEKMALKNHTVGKGGATAVTSG